MIKKLSHYPNFLKLYLANTLSRFGDSIDMIAYGYMVYQLTGSKLLLATLYMINVLPNILFSSFAGAVVDFFPKKSIIILGDVLRGVVVLVTAFVFYFGRLEPWHLFVLTFINSTVESFVSPSQSATIPQLIDEEHYLFVNSTLQSITKVVELAGLAVAGIVIGFIGIAGAMVIDAVTFFVSCIIMLYVKFPHEEKKSLTPENYATSYKEGLNFVLKQKGFLALVLSMAVLNFLLTPINALAPAYVADVLKRGPEAIGYFSIAFIVGNIVGGVVVGKIGKAFSFKIMIAFGLTLTGVAYTMLALPGFLESVSPLAIACCAAFLVGFFVTFASAGLSTLFMSIIPKEMMARVSSVLGMFALSAMPLGSLTSGIISNYVGIEYVIVLFGILFVLTTLLPIYALKRMEIGLSH